MAAAAAPSAEATNGPPLGAVGIEAAAGLVGVSPSAIRSWERQGLVSPLRTPGGARRYRPTDLDRLRAIRAWRTLDGLNAAAIRRLLRDGEGVGAVVTGAARPGLAPGSAVEVAAGAVPADIDRPPASGAPSVDQPSARDIADALRETRRSRGLTLREAAARSGLSASFVSAVERGTSGASVAALRRLLGAYDTTLAELVGAAGPGSEGHDDESHGGKGQGDGQGRDVRSRRLVAASARHAVAAGTGVRIENLSDGSRLLEPQLFVLAPGASSHGPYSHPGEEFMYVLHGALGVWLEPADESYVLGPGDSLTFPSTLAHRFQAMGSDETRVIWVNTPPTF